MRVLVSSREIVRVIAVPRSLVPNLGTPSNPKEISITQKPGRGLLAAAKVAKEVTDLKLVNVFVKNGFDEVWTYLQPCGSGELAHIRVTEDQNGEMVPTKKGIAVDAADLPKLAKAVRELVLAVPGRGA
jgi:hypothetical protein